MSRPILILLVLLFAGWSMFGFSVSLDNIGLDAASGQPVLTWTSRVEQDLDYYQVRRKAGSEIDFSDIGDRIAPKGGGQAYSFTDVELYKAGEVVEYELLAVAIDGDERTFGPLSFNYTPTAVRRTWGSIKAMFQ